MTAQQIAAIARSKGLRAAREALDQEQRSFIVPKPCVHVRIVLPCVRSLLST